MMKTLTLLFTLASFSAFAQIPVKWPLTGNYPKGFEIVVNQDPQNVILSITNTTLKKSIPKSNFTFDVTTSPEYQNILASLAQTIQERDLARTQYESEAREHENTKRKMLELVTMVKKIRAIHEMDTAVLIWFPKTAFKKQ